MRLRRPRHALTLLLLAPAVLVAMVPLIRSLGVQVELPFLDRILEGFVEPALTDLRFQQRAPGTWPADLVLVEIDERTQEKFGTWRWPRSQTAELINRIKQLEPKTIASLLYARRPDPSDPQGDHALAQALAGTVQAVAEDSGGVMRPQFGDVSRGALRLGASQIWSDHDRVVRRYAPLRRVQGESRFMPSLALAAVMAHRGIEEIEWDHNAGPWSWTQIALGDGPPLQLYGGSFLLDFAREDPPPVISAAEVLQEDNTQALRERFKGKLVLLYVNPRIGVRTPFESMSNGRIEAYAIRSIDSGRVPHLVRLQPKWRIAVLLWIAVVFVLVYRSQRVQTRPTVLLIGVGVLVAGYFVLAFVLAGLADTFIPIAAPVLAVVYLAGVFLVVPHFRDLEHKSRLAPDAGDAADAPTGRVAIVFTDIQDSTPLWEDCPEAMAEALVLHNQTMRRWIRRVGAYEVKTEGDAFMIVAPTIESALELCLGAQAELMKVDWPAALLDHEISRPEHEGNEPTFRGLRVRMGVHLGEPDPQPTRTGRMDYFGPDVNRAARISGMAFGGQIMLSGVAWRAARNSLVALGSPVATSLGQYRLKGLKTLVQLISLVPRSLQHRRFDAPEVETLAPARRARTGPLQVGSRLGTRYQLIDVLGEGGMATVYRARDLELDEDVAIKVLHRSLTEGEETLTQIKNELKTARRVTDAGVVRLHDFGVDAGDVFITMQLAEGGTLAEREERGTPTQTDALRIAFEVAQGLAAVHRGGIVHRDIKPQNVMFDSTGRACLGDFGISQFESTHADLGEVVGTPQYMSPEQLLGDAATPASDVYSFGVLMYELFTGRLPFEGSISRQITGRLTSNPPSLGEEVAPEVSAVILRALSRETSGRFENGEQLVAALEGLLNE